MKVVIDPQWSFEEAFNAAHDAYTGVGISSRGYRNSVLMAWGNIVGKKRALDDFNRLVVEYGTKKALAEVMGISQSSLRKIEKHFIQIPEPISTALSPLNIRMILGQHLPLDENREYEFKEITVGNRNPVRSILKIVEEYIVSFLNSDGGRILWGVADDSHEIVGVRLSQGQRDELFRGVNGKIATIQPAMDPTAFYTHLHPIFDKKGVIEDLFVVEVGVPKVNSSRLYFAHDNQTYVRVEGVKQKLMGPAIQDWIERRIFESE